MLNLSVAPAGLDAPAIYHSFQPLYDIESWTILGYEVFIRSNHFKNPENLFTQAKKEGWLYKIDIQSIYQACLTFYSKEKLPEDKLLFINVFPSTLLHSNFLLFFQDLVETFPQIKKNVVFEVNEAETIDNMTELQSRIAFLKEHGILIAIDDLGKGWASLTRIVEVKPDIIKLDFFFSKNLSTSTEKQEMIRFLVAYCKTLNIMLILEGIEYEEDLLIARSLDVKVGQGYLLGKPDSLSKIG